jgi:hypothetical protein
MASENAKIDDNNKPVALAITDDSNKYRKMWRIDDTTKGLKVMLVGGAGSGTVTSVSVVTANGISGTVATATTTPAITIVLGAITPSSVQITGLTASQILGLDASSNVISLPVATYPSLTELSYVKGVTSGIQTQINAKGAGTVTAVSVATANGVSGSSSGGATPALTITLGAITPTSIVASGTIAGSNLSGTNTGDNATNSQYSYLVYSPSSINPQPDYRVANINPRGFETATTGYASRFVMPFKMTVNHIRVRTGTISGTATGDVAIFSEDGQTRIMKGTFTGNFSSNTTMDATISSVVLNPGIYYIFFVPSATIGTLELYASTAACNLNSTNPQDGTIAVSSGVIPTTFTPVSLSYTSIAGIIFQLTV